MSIVRSRTHPISLSLSHSPTKARQETLRYHLFPLTPCHNLYETTENVLRHASGPVHTIPPVTYLLTLESQCIPGIVRSSSSSLFTVYMLSGVLQMEYRRKALLKHQVPNQIPAAVVLAKYPKKGIWLIFPTGAYPLLNHRYTWHSVKYL